MSPLLAARSAAAHGDGHAGAVPHHDPGGCARVGQGRDGPPNGRGDGKRDSAERTLPGHAIPPPPPPQGNIARWLKKEGEEIGPGQLLAEVETDKATIEWEAQEEGFLAKILKPDGSKDIAIGEPVYVLCEEESAVAAFKDYVPGEPCVRACDQANMA